MPENPSSFLYSLEGPFDAAAGKLLSALGISSEGKPREAVLLGIQKRGLLLVHLLECPLASPSRLSVAELLQAQLPPTLVRIRRSLKPKRVILIDQELHPYFASLNQAELGCPLWLADLGAPDAGEGELAGLRLALGVGSAG